VPLEGRHVSCEARSYRGSSLERCFDRGIRLSRLIIPTKVWGEADEQTPMRHWDTICPTSCRDVALERRERSQSESPMCKGEEHRCCQHLCWLGSPSAYLGNMSLMSRIPRSKQLPSVRSSGLPRSTQNAPQPYVLNRRVHVPQQSTQKPAQREATPTKATPTPSPTAHARHRRSRFAHSGGRAGHTPPTRVQQLVARGPAASARRRPLRFHPCPVQWHQQKSRKRQEKRQKRGIAIALC